VPAQHASQISRELDVVDLDGTIDTVWLAPDAEAVLNFLCLRASPFLYGELYEELYNKVLSSAPRSGASPLITL
jgi:hypothetical protein